MEQGMNAILKQVFRRLHYPLDVILLCVRWYIAYPLSLRHLEEMMAERIPLHTSLLLKLARVCDAGSKIHHSLHA
ncbi:hypothetical protein BGV48_24475 [Burkholderia ubonensis]|nr:hypothetical protein BGV48_24475 [Burkholderia ubonensis]